MAAPVTPSMKCVLANFPSSQVKTINIFLIVMHFCIHDLTGLFLENLLEPLQDLLRKRVFSVDRIGGAEIGAGLASLPSASMAMMLLQTQ